MKPQWRWFLGGVGVALALLLLALIFMAYQSPELLLDWANLRYCGQVGLRRRVNQHPGRRPHGLASAQGRGVGGQLPA